jgi:hypothetical protein
MDTRIAVFGAGGPFTNLQFHWNEGGDAIAEKQPIAVKAA